jgi:hypothetical protein
MKCLICPNEIDDKREFLPSYSEELRRMIYDEAGQRAHAMEQNRWQQVELCLGPCGEVTILLGHLCPSCTTREAIERLQLTKAEERVNPLDSRSALMLAWMTSTPARPPAAHSARVTAANVDAVSERPRQTA